MTLKEAKTIIEIHDYHKAKRNEARREGDEETAVIHQTCLTNMQADYDKASKIVIKHNG